MAIDDVHSTVKTALEGVHDEPISGLHDIRLSDLNETELEHAKDALRALHQLDAALAARSSFDRIEPPNEVSHSDEYE